MNNVARLETGNFFHEPVSSGGIRDVIKTYRRHLPIFLAVLCAVVLAMAIYTFAKTPHYTAETSVVVAPRKAEVGSDRSSPLSDPTTDASVDTQVEVLRSPALAGIVADRLRLAEPSQYVRLTREQGPIAKALPAFARPAPEIPATVAERRAAVIRLLQRNLDVRRVAQTFVLELTYTSADPKLAADIVNAFAAAYVRQSLDLKLDAALKARGLLGAQLERARSEVNAAEAAIGHYKIANNLMSVAGATVAEQELMALDQQAAIARAAQAEAMARYQTANQQMRRGSNGEDVGEALGSPVVQELRRQRADVSRRLADLSARYGPRHPAITAAQQQLADMDAQIHSEVRRILSGLEAQSHVAARRTGSLQESVEQTRGALASNNAAAVRLAELQLRANAARGLYEELLDRVREIGTQVATTQPDARISNLAVVPPKPSAPNVKINMLVALLLGIAAGIAVVVVRQQLDQGLSTLDDVEGRLQLPYLAGLPTLRSAIVGGRGGDPVAALVDHRDSAYAEGFRSLAASVLQGGSKQPVRTIIMTSALPNEGKTTAAIGLARVLAMSGKKVVLVDADLRRPRVSRALQLRPVIGLREVLDGEASLGAALIEDEASGAVILPMVPGTRFQSSPIEDGRFDTLIHQLKTQFDIIVFDVSPILPVVEGRLLAKRGDAVVLLARWRKTPEPAVELAAHLLRGVGVTATGVALTRVDLHALSRSGYGDPAQFLKLYANYYQ